MSRERALADSRSGLARQSRFFLLFLLLLSCIPHLPLEASYSRDYKPKHSMVRVNSLNCYVATPAQSTTKGIIMSLPQLKLVVKIDAALKKHVGSVLLILQPNIFFWMVWIPKENIVNTYSYTACTTVYIYIYVIMHILSQALWTWKLTGLNHVMH